MGKRLCYHTAFWVLYVLYKSYLNFDSGSSGVEGKSGMVLFLTIVLVQTVFLVVKIPLVYALFAVTNRFLSKQWALPQTIVAGIGLFAFAVLGSILINHFVVYGWIFQTQIDLWESLTSFQSIGYWFFILAFVSGIAISIKLTRLSIRQKIEEQELLKKKLEIELQFLKAQSNPHFLFNTLNNIYGLARKNSDQTADVVLKLSSMLRYMLYENARDSIAIESEIKIINDYIELEKLRYTNRLNVTFSHSIDNYKEKIAPLLLLPFVENAFKHGAGESRFESFIDINLTLQNQQLAYEIKNSKEGSGDDERTGPNDPDQAEAKIGLGNIKRQLELLYPKHRLAIDNTPTAFTVKLHINLNDGKI
ncbi:sensor histidine kinase [Flavobacterium sp.]|uniref:sensor histidine kinase n=1 Tax=Flavobacterium sp. TaxID=239 RepID=UPI0039E42A07